MSDSSPRIAPRLVIDASVAVKWFVEEEHSGRAQVLLRQRTERLAPDFLRIEVANVFLKKVRRGELPQEVVGRALDLLEGFVRLEPSNALVPLAYEVAQARNRSIYDAIYLALARERQCALVTADERLFNAMRGSSEDSLLWIEDVPSPPR